MLQIVEVELGDVDRDYFVTRSLAEGELIRFKDMIKTLRDASILKHNESI
jgi:hypothetical protein